MIAMALSLNPEILIADEPTTALDVTVQREVLDLIRDIADDTNTAVLLITHDMGVVADVADRVIVMRSGRVVETGPSTALFAAPTEPYTQALLAAVPRRAAADEPTEPRPDEGETVPALSVADLTVRYRTGRFRATRSVDVVDSVSFDVHPREFFGLVGESGSGKSTIGRAIVGLAPIASGTIRVGDVHIGDGTHADLHRARRRIGVVFQNPTASLDPRRSVGDAIAEPLAVINGLRGPAIRQRIDELLEAVELPAAWSHRYPHELSGGQRQRVAIARALTINPDLIIADEPTSALDVSVQATVLELLSRLQAEHGFACLFISHDLAVVGQLCHRVAVLQNGRIVEQGTTAQVFNAPASAFARTLLAAAPVPDPAAQRAARADRRRSR